MVIGNELNGGEVDRRRARLDKGLRRSRTGDG